MRPRSHMMVVKTKLVPSTTIMLHSGIFQCLPISINHMALDLRFI